MPHDQYLDRFFDLNRPLLKCDFCSSELPQRRMVKHLQRAHLSGYQSQRRDILHATPETQAINSTMTIIELSDSEDKNEKMRKQTHEKAVQCEAEMDTTSQLSNL